MSDVEIILSAFPRIYFACRPRQVTDPVDGKVLSFHQATILSHLDLVDPTMVGELAGHLGVTASTMSLNLSRLEEGGYVTRQRDPEDRRVMNVCLTEAGERVRLAPVRSPIGGLEAHWVRHLVGDLPPDLPRLGAGLASSRDRGWLGCQTHRYFPAFLRHRPSAQN